MDEILDGVLHWTAFHERIRQPVHSYLHVASGAVFDPLLPPDISPDALAAAAIPSVVLLSNRHHLRDAAPLAEAFGCRIRCHEAGLHEFTDHGQGPDVEGFAFGDTVAPGVTALEVGVLTPEDTAFHVAVGPGALLFADGLIRSDGELGFVGDELMGGYPEAVKAGLRERLGTLAEREDFDALLFAHGEPLTSGGRAALRAFVARW